MDMETEMEIYTHIYIYIEFCFLRYVSAGISAFGFN